MEDVNDLGHAEEASNVEMKKLTEEEPAQIQIFKVIRAKRKEKLVSKRQRRKYLLWTKEETRLFYEGLDLYGKDWASLAKHIKSRDRK